ncbi:protein of unknown function [Pseudodesulfovibrio profundus]|uniref:Uncharacterized protein n=1 Tax=Pseudodesulfovibrio profundus TaxID=57320 RepID=A0A2C8F965_9BACT|nr:protein of unknown function [Pseudodesulfovibrio profundus]
MNRRHGDFQSIINDFPIYPKLSRIALFALIHLTKNNFLLVFISQGDTSHPVLPWPILVLG